VADERQTEITHNLEHLRNPEEQARLDAVVRLGRLKAQRAVDPLAATLAGDSSPKVRDAAARALGMIGSPKALPALQRAAEADNDRDVRHSAQFSVELVQANH
jgi:HEAT repeat protein